LGFSLLFSYLSLLTVVTIFDMLSLLAAIFFFFPFFHTPLVSHLSSELNPFGFWSLDATILALVVGKQG